MAKRNSGKPRRKGELYETPAWVVLDGLVPWFPVGGMRVAEPDCGSGQAVAALQEAGASVIASDVRLNPRYLKRPGMPHVEIYDFAAMGLRGLIANPRAVDAIVTNPPYGPRGETACQFIVQGLEWLRVLDRTSGFLALLLPIDFDCAPGRARLFDLCPEFHASIRLRRRIEFFPRAVDGSGPSEHHAWFIWRKPRFDRQYPVTFYGPKVEA